MNARKNTKRQSLIAEIYKLRRALSALICWAGESPDGPEWATPEAKARNRAMFEKALNDASECFPEGYNSLDDMIESN